MNKDLISFDPSVLPENRTAASSEATAATLRAFMKKYEKDLEAQRRLASASARREIVTIIIASLSLLLALADKFHVLCDLASQLF